jgi:hypothetical protein
MPPFSSFSSYSTTTTTTTTTILLTLYLQPRLARYIWQFGLEAMFPDGEAPSKNGHGDRVQGAQEACRLALVTQ